MKNAKTTILKKGCKEMNNYSNLMDDTRVAFSEMGLSMTEIIEKMRDVARAYGLDFEVRVLNKYAKPYNPIDIEGCENELYSTDNDIAIGFLGDGCVSEVYDALEKIEGERVECICRILNTWEEWAEMFNIYPENKDDDRAEKIRKGTGLTDEELGAPDTMSLIFKVRE